MVGGCFDSVFFMLCCACIGLLIWCLFGILRYGFACLWFDVCCCFIVEGCFVCVLTVFAFRCLARSGLVLDLMDICGLYL